MMEKWRLVLSILVVSTLTVGHGMPLISSGSDNPREIKGQDPTGGLLNASNPNRPHSTLPKRSIDDAENGLDEEVILSSNQDYTSTFPFVISKKSATVLNKLVTALRNSLDQNTSSRNSDFLRDKDILPLRNGANYEMFNLQRRNPKDRKNYLRCYFNAVSCF